MILRPLSRLALSRILSILLLSTVRSLRALARSLALRRFVRLFCIIRLRLRMIRMRFIIFCLRLTCCRVLMRTLRLLARALLMALLMSLPLIMSFIFCGRRFVSLSLCFPERPVLRSCRCLRLSSRLIWVRRVRVVRLSLRLLSCARPRVLTRPRLRWVSLLIRLRLIFL